MYFIFVISGIMYSQSLLQKKNPFRGPYHPVGGCFAIMTCTLSFK